MTSFGIETVLDKPSIPTWEMEGRMEVIPQTWDANTPQVPTDVAQNDPEGDDVIFVEDKPKDVPQSGAVVSVAEQ
jgi:hypothetical protein